MKSAIHFASPSPNWVPAAVAETARALRAKAVEHGNPEHVKLLDRLIFDSRMRAVWKQLSKRRLHNYAPTGDFLAPGKETFRPADLETGGAERQARASVLRLNPTKANLRDASKLDDEASRIVLYADYLRGVDHKLMLQEASAKFIFQVAFSTGAHRPFAIPESVIKKDLERYVRQLRKLAKQLEGRPEPEAGVAKNIQKVARKVVSAGTARERKFREGGFIISRARGDLGERAAILCLGRAANERFGSPLYGTVATLTSVIFNKRISVQRVRVTLGSSANSP